MKKNKISKIIFLILIILLVISIIIATFTQKKKNLTIDMYDKLCNMENYTFSIKKENIDTDYILTISRRGLDISIDANFPDEHTTTVVTDESAYYVIHSKQEYYLYDTTQIDADILKNELAGIEEENYKHGYEKINGKQYYFEEYENITTFIMLSNYNADEDNLKTRLYFSDGKISYIKNIIEEQEELLKIDFSDIIDDNLFSIPDSYAEI